MDWFRYGNGLRHEKVNQHWLSEAELKNALLIKNACISEAAIHRCVTKNFQDCKIHRKTPVPESAF